MDPTTRCLLASGRAAVSLAAHRHTRTRGEYEDPGAQGFRTLREPTRHASSTREPCAVFQVCTLCRRLTDLISPADHRGFARDERARLSSRSGVSSSEWPLEREWQRRARDVPRDAAGRFAKLSACSDGGATSRPSMGARQQRKLPEFRARSARSRACEIEVALTITSSADIRGESMDLLSSTAPEQLIEHAALDSQGSARHSSMPSIAASSRIDRCRTKPHLARKRVTARKNHFGSARDRRS